ncbi:MAG TPA: histidine kinase [Treponema sp.]|nr:histidine kinase [Treponema sp.]
MKREGTTVVLLATTVEEEKQRLDALNRSRSLGFRILTPATLREADLIIFEEKVDVIVTDLSFADGAFADWLNLWPRPFVLLAYYGEEPRIDELLRDESCSVVMRDVGFRHLGVLPTMIRKVLNVRESLDRQNVHLQISERRYLELIRSLPDIVYNLDSDGHFVYVNDSISQLGYEPAELIGKHFSHIVEDEDVPLVSRAIVLEGFRGRETGPEAAPKLFDERRSGDRMTRNLEVRLKHRHDFSPGDPVGKVDAYGEVSSVGFDLPEYEGSPIGTVGVIRDITQRKRAELLLVESLHSKEILLKEIHHRVKNNLQVVSSLLYLQSGTIEDERSRIVFQDCQTQIQSMAMVHEQLYQSESLQSIDIQSFVVSLLDYLFKIYDVDSSSIAYAVDCVDVLFGIDQAMPIALIINELVSNSLKHGLARSSGNIDVRLSGSERGQLRLEVCDSGAGMPEGFEFDATGTIGIQIVRALAAQLGGSVSWENAPGAHFVVLFPHVPAPV